MSKNFYNIKKAKKMLDYGSRKGMGPFRCKPQKLKTPEKEMPSEPNTRSKKVPPVD